jgi:DNA invertase Pin-like site-specific DNA recombinase
MFIDKIKKLEATKARLAALEKSVAAELTHELAALHRKYGFDSLASFFKAVRAAASGRGKTAKRAPAKAARKAGGRKRRRRAVITDATRAEVKKLSEAGRTGAEIARTVGISLPSVQNVKKALGLVKSRK